jgi:hypothetical protein
MAPRVLLHLYSYGDGMKEQPVGVHVISPDEFPRVAAQARLSSVVFEIMTGRTGGKKRFFGAVRRVLPLNPPLLRSASWDALSDSLFEGLRSLDSDRITILWRDAREWEEVFLEELGIAIAVLDDVARSLGNEAYTAGPPKRVDVFVTPPPGINPQTFQVGMR